MKKVSTDDCWLWARATTPSGGYGIMGIAGTGKTNHAHRILYEHWVSTIPQGYDVDHLCRVTLCINPSHLEAVTRRENTIRGNLPEVSRQRQLSKTHCPNNHPYSGDNLYSRPDGGRDCKNCQRERTKRYQRAKEY